MDCSNPLAHNCQSTQPEVGEGPFHSMLQRAPPRSNFLSYSYSKQHAQDKTLSAQNSTCKVAGAALPSLPMGKFQYLSMSATWRCSATSEAIRVRSALLSPLAAKLMGSSVPQGPFAIFTTEFPLASSVYPIKCNSSRYSAQIHLQIAPEGQLDK